MRKEVELQNFLTNGVNAAEWSASLSPATTPLGNRPWGSHEYEAGICPRSDVDVLHKRKSLGHVECLVTIPSFSCTSPVHCHV
jgi:hypothetical protein